MSDNDLMLRILREIQRDLSDMRDDRAVLIAILDRHESSIDGISSELRALRSQLDRFRTEIRDRLNDMNERLSRIEDALHARKKP